MTVSRSSLKPGKKKLYSTGDYVHVIDIFAENKNIPTWILQIAKKLWFRLTHADCGSNIGWNYVYNAVLEDVYQNICSGSEIAGYGCSVFEIT